MTSGVCKRCKREVAHTRNGLCSPCAGVVKRACGFRVVLRQRGDDVLEAQALGGPWLTPTLAGGLWLSGAGAFSAA